MAGGKTMTVPVQTTLHGSKAGLTPDNRLALQGADGKQYPVTPAPGTQTASAFQRVLSYPIPQAALTGSEVDLSDTITVPDNVIVHDCFLTVAAGRGATATLDVGTIDGTNDPDGLLDGVNIQNAGIITGGPVTTTGLNETYISGMTHGALTHYIRNGADDAGETGVIYPRATPALAGDGISVTSSGDFSAGQDPEIVLHLIVTEFDATLL